jgi:TrmH family RNA methyltransferase
MGLSATITSRTNAKVKALRSSFSGKASRPGDVVGLEGENLIREAVRAGLAFEAIFVREGSSVALEDWIAEGLRAREWVVLRADVFDSAVATDSPQGVAATLRIPELAASLEGTVLMLEDLQDPGNLGTLLRSAEAFLVRRIFVTPGTVSAWNPKAVRASAGSVFRLPVTRCSLAEMKAWSTGHGVKVVAAVARSKDATPVMHARLLAPCALMIGNEGAGLSRAAMEMCNERVNIPCAVESLNAATAGTTMMYEAFRQNLQRELMEMPAARGLQ